MPGTARYASLDIGSNTVRLFVAEKNNGGCREIHSSQVITRLSEGLHDAGNLSRQAIDRTVRGLEQLIADAERFRPFKIAAIATHALRQADNKKEFEDTFRRTLGFGIKIISWEEEARLSLKGMETVIKTARPVLLFDIGGGSTEFIYRASDGKISMVGTHLGVVRLCETWIKKAPLVQSEYSGLEKYLEGEIGRVAEQLETESGFLLVGTAGTVTSMAAIHLNMREYDPRKINNCVLSVAVLEEMSARVGAMTIEERGELPSLQDGREDLIIPGFAIVLAVMKGFGADSLLVSDAGLREGALAGAMDGTLEGAVI
jgi:exopolyphosphatase/guanosine-5'-triphosphate,3'-diphosphate pyrophosphatase